VELLAAEHDPGARDALIKRAKMLAMNGASAQAFDFRPSALSFDVGSEPPAPSWIVVGQLERKQVGVLSADTGAAKSIVSQNLALQGIAGLDWLGCETRMRRVLYIDEENPCSTAIRRLKAMGLQDGELNRLRYYDRKGLSIGDGGRTDQWLDAELEGFKPDLLIIDTLMASTAVADTNDNGQAVKMMKHLRALAEARDLAVLVLHHERKQSREHPNSSGQAMMGARQWAGQADVHMTLTVASAMDVQEGDALVNPEALKRLRKTFKWRPAEKDREGEPNRPQLVSVTSEKGEEGKLLWMLVENEGEDKTPSAADSLASAIGEAVQRSDGELRTAEIAKAVGHDAQGKAFRRALEAAVDHDYIAKAKHGTYAAGSATLLGLLDV
jgi:hypothetical protein